MTVFARLLVFCLLLACGARGALAAEEITSFDVRIDVAGTGKLTVTERIAVEVEGNRISRGILRDIPLRYEDASGRTGEVGLDVLSVRRDGRDEPYTTERGSGVLRLRIGDPDVFLPYGKHDYEITYETTRQIRFFDDYDELYWNVTGNAWEFPILRASTEIRLPAGARATDVTYYTGGYGSTDQAARSQLLDGGNIVRVQTTQGLGSEEGLTVVVAFPKGVVSPPSAEELRADWWRDNLGWIAGAGGLLLVFAYYLWSWNRVGRDPPEDVIVPRWTPPDGVSPALANYIEQRGFRGGGWDAFAASLIDLAVKGHVEIRQPGKTMTIVRMDSGVPQDLGIGQQAIVAALPGKGDALSVSAAGGATVQKIGNAFRSAIEREHRNRFYRANPLYLVLGIFMSVVVLIATLVLGRFSPELLVGGVGVAIPAIIISVIAVNTGRSFRNARSLFSRIMSVVTAAIGGFIALTVAGGFLSVLTESDFDARMLAVVAGLVILNLVFFFLMGAPTQLGQKLTAEIEGLKRYLTLAEQDRMNMRGAPEMSPQHFETLLPYAVALGVEKPWSRTFDAWLATAVAAGAAAAYVGPTWYTGTDFSPGSIGKSLGDMTGSLSNSLTASLPAPKSSSSGFSSGGGFSGGGGGGGGGGGW